MYYPVVEALSYYSDIVDFRSENVSIRCPYFDHEDARPSLSINIFSGLWLCHGCGRSGDYKKLIYALESDRVGYSIDPWELQLALAGIVLGKIPDNVKRVVSFEKARYRSKKRDDQALFLASEFFFGLKKPDWNVIQYHYLLDRGFDRQTLLNFDVRLNLNSEFQILIPIYQQHVFMGYTSRKAFDCEKSETKYWHSPGMHKSEIVFGNLEKGPVLVVEGPLDKIMAHQLGFSNVACTFGWAMSAVQAAHIEKYATEIIDAQDNDPRGEEGAKRSRELLPRIQHRRFNYPRSIKDMGSMYSNKSDFTTTMFAPAAITPTVMQLVS